MDYVGERGRFFLLIAAGLVGAGLICWGTLFALRYVDSGLNRPKQAQAKVFRRTLVEDLRVTRHGIRGVDFIRCGACRIEKRKKGLFTFGGMNVLVLEDLSVVLPEVEEKDEPPEKGDDDVRGIVQRMGVSDGFLKERGIPMKFSGLKISNLSVGRLDETNRPYAVFAAKSAEAVRGGLRLSRCIVYERETKSPVSVTGAMLVRVGNKLRLKWNGGEMGLN